MHMLDLVQLLNGSGFPFPLPGLQAGLPENCSLNNFLTIGITTHCLCHSFASHLFENGVDIKIIQELMGHNAIKTTEIYSHVIMKKLENIKSPIDNLDI
ncbi:MAG: tyrosine-type recombinase/integrase [Bacteroidales bacterium]|nr:tyrosine-type recombinase/integrase [Bacteroidales bacterium]